MSTHYDLYETPDIRNTGEQQPLHARIVPNGTYTQKEFVERVARYQHFPSNMIDGVVGAIVEELGELLGHGYIVELGELGHFSISLKCTQKVMDKKELRAESVRLGNVHLRISKNFRQKVKECMELERVVGSRQISHKAETFVEQRKQILKDFLQQNGAVSRAEYARLVGLPRKKAIADLNAFIEQGIIRKRGAGRTVFYV